MKKRNNWPRSQARLSESHQRITANSENTTLSWPLKQFSSEYTHSTHPKSNANGGLPRPFFVAVKLFVFLFGVVILEGLFRSIFAISLSPFRFGYFGYLVREVLILNLGVLTLIFPVYLWLAARNSGSIRGKGVWLVASLLSSFSASLILVALVSQLLFLDLLSLSLYDILGIIGGNVSLSLIEKFSKLTLTGVSACLICLAYVFLRFAFTGESLERMPQGESKTPTKKKSHDQDLLSRISGKAFLRVFSATYFKMPKFKIELGSLFSLFSKLWETAHTPLANAIARKGKGFAPEYKGASTSEAQASGEASLFGKPSARKDNPVQGDSHLHVKASRSQRLGRLLRSGCVDISSRFQRFLSRASTKFHEFLAKRALLTIISSLQRAISLQTIRRHAGNISARLSNLNIFTPKFEKDYVGSRNVRLGLDYQEIFSSRKSYSLGYEARQNIAGENKDPVNTLENDSSDSGHTESPFRATESLANLDDNIHDETSEVAASSIFMDGDDTLKTQVERRPIPEVNTESRAFANPYEGEGGYLKKEAEKEVETESPETLTRNPLFNPEPSKYESPKLFSWIKTGNNPLIATQALSRKVDAIPTSPISTPPLSYNSLEPVTSLSRRIEKVDKVLNAGFSLDLLADFPSGYASTIQFRSNEEVDESGMQILEQLNNFGVGGDIIARHKGPVVSLYEFRPSKGVKVAKITGLQDELAMKLRATSVRIIAPLPGQDAIGIEVPNREHEIVGLKEILQSEEFLSNRSPLTIALGKDSYGRPAVQDIAKMPHLLIAGATGTGKSVSINALLLSLLFKSTPEDLNLVLIDPKILELSVYEGIPHLKVPVITDCKKARAVLEWAVKEMERRYKLMQRYGVRNVDAFNKVLQHNDLDEQQPLSKVVIVIDELADLMFQVGKDLEELIARLAQKARASGIHLVLATQRPSVDVITGLIKANFPVRISFRVTSRIDSRTILDTQGADKLLGKGDMLLSLPGVNNLIRCHGAFVTDDDVRLAVNDLKERWGPPDYDPYVVALCEKAVSDEDTGGDSSDDEEDPMYEEALRVVIKKGTASTSMIQRALRIGYNRAARIIDMMEDRGVIGPQDGAKPREILINAAEAEEAYE